MAEVPVSAEGMNMTGSSHELASTSIVGQLTPDAEKQPLAQKDKRTHQKRENRIRKRPCKFFQAGECRYGARCWLSHETCSDQACDEISGHVVQHMSSADGHEQEYSTDVRVLESESCASAGDTEGNGGSTIMLCAIGGKEQVTTAPMATCKFYVRTGRCRFGKQCRYSHDAERSTKTVKPTGGNTEINKEVIKSGNQACDEVSGSGVQQSSGAEDHEQEYSTDVRVLESESCASAGSTEENGGSTIMLCVIEGKEQVTTAPMAACKFYVRMGRCRFGKQCRYSHDAERSTKTVEPTGGNTEIKKEVIKSGNQACDEVSGSGVQQSSGAEDHEQEYSTDVRVLESESCASAGGTEENGGNTIMLCVIEGKEQVTTAPMAACKFYVRTGRCRFGKQCRYSHDAERSTKTVEPTGSNAEMKNEVIRSQPPQDNSSTRKQIDAKQMPGLQQKLRSRAIKTCRYFKAGNCTMGDKCKFRHPAVSGDSSVLNGWHSEANTPGQGLSRKQSTQTVFGRHTKLSLDKSSADDLRKLRQTEIQLLKKRYPKATETEDEPKHYKFIFVPTDPDWPYDVKELDLSVSFPESYPKEVMQVHVTEQNLPLPVRQQVEECMTEWLDEKSQTLESTGQVELLFRPLLRWLDKNLEEMFTKGLMQYKRELVAHAAGLQFVPASALQKQLNSGSQGDLAAESCDKGIVAWNGSKNPSVESTCMGGTASNGSSDQAATMDDKGAGSSLLDPSRRGTEVKLQNLNLGENVATLNATKVHVIVQCARCHTFVEVSTVPARVNSVCCPKCSRQLLVVFRPSIIHSFSPVLGYLDLEGCIAFDLVMLECSFLLVCLNCSEETKIQGLATGSPKELWCQNCHQKMTVAVNSVRFTQLHSTQSIDSKHVHTVDAKTPRRVAKDPAIQPGSPLPDNGTCRHYKKSFRWLRFPCCGKAYPCDKCHDEKEMDHEMKFANRMICGFCAKEQPFAFEGLCTGCQSSMTKKNSAHWEGGRGCRDKIKMSRGDAKKFANSSKTISRKAEQKSEQKSKSNQKPKIIKLRHV